MCAFSKIGGHFESLGTAYLLRDSRQSLEKVAAKLKKIFIMTSECEGDDIKDESRKAVLRGINKWASAAAEKAWATSAIPGPCFICSWTL